MDRAGHKRQPLWMPVSIAKIITNPFMALGAMRC